MTSNPIRAVSTWIAMNAQGFIAGVITTVIIATFVSLLVLRRGRKAVRGGIFKLVDWGRRELVRGMKRADGDEVVGLGGEGGKEVKAEVGGDGANVGRVGVTAVERGEVGKKEKRERKPFEFRKRLRNEPPEGQDPFVDYDYYECFDAVQKEFKDAWGKDLEWKTNCLDLLTESSLLIDYKRWVLTTKESKGISEKERAFYQGLYDNLMIDFDEVWEEDDENDMRHGKTVADSFELFDFLREIRAREKQKKAGNSTH